MRSILMVSVSSLFLVGCSRGIPPTEAAALRLKARMHEVRASPIDAENFKKGDALTKVRMANLFFVAPVRAEGYDFDLTVAEFCRIAVQGKRDIEWHIATGMLSVWNDLRSEFSEGGYLS